MDAKELLRRYAAGERDFHTADLSGHICIIDLSGAGLKRQSCLKQIEWGELNRGRPKGNSQASQFEWGTSEWGTFGGGRPV